MRTHNTNLDVVVDDVPDQHDGACVDETPYTIGGKPVVFDWHLDRRATERSIPDAAIVAAMSGDSSKRVNARTAVQRGRKVHKYEVLGVPTVREQAHREVRTRRVPVKVVVHEYRDVVNVVSVMAPTMSEFRAAASS